MKKESLKLLMSAFLIASVALVSQCSNDDSSDDSTDTQTAGQKAAACSGTTATAGCAIEGTWTSDFEVPADTEVYLRGKVTFSTGTTLTIGEGVTIKGVTGGSLSYLIIDQGADIIATGSALKPITFTSENAEGSRSKSDWGGVIINGEATINEGTGTADGEGDSGTYGGSTDTDDSGTMQYVRIMFAGRQFSESNELNGLCLQGVGSGTTLDYIQTHNNKDDGIEFFGGSVDISHLVTTYNGDDMLDCTYGWTGNGQYIITASIDGGDKAIEHDNNEGTPAATPNTNIKYANVTALADADGDDTARIRHGDIIVEFKNSYFYNGAGKETLDLDDQADVTVTYSLLEYHKTAVETGEGASLTVSNNTEVDSTGMAGDTEFIDSTLWSSASALATNGAAAFAPVASPTNTATPDTAQMAGVHSNITPANWIGAVQSSASNWAAGWTEFPAN